MMALLMATGASAAKFFTSLDRDTVVLGETVTLTFTFEGASPGGMPQLPAIPGLQVAGAVSSGLNSSSGPDGQMHTVQTYSVPFLAKQAGEFQIPSFQIELAGLKLSTSPLKLKVLREDPSAPPVEFANKSAFLWLVLPRKEFYVGETFVAELRLYVRSGVRNIGGFQPPPLQGEGFTAGKWVEAPNYQRRVGNRQFTALSMLCAATAVKSGPLKIEALKAGVVLNPPDIFENMLGRRSDTEQVALFLEPPVAPVLPLPKQNVPADFTGAVGSFTMTASVSPTNIATGDPITVRIQISGRGAIDSLTLPAQAAWRDFKTYPPTSNIETTDKLGLLGTKTFEQIVSAENSNLKELPAFSFAFFDPDVKEYRTLTQPAVALLVRPGAATPAPSVVTSAKSSSDAPPPAQDIVHIKPRLGALAQVGPPLVLQPWFVGLQSVPVFAWLAAVGWRKRVDSLANNPRLRRQREVARILRAGLVELRRHAATSQPEQFFATLFRLLQEQLGERLDCPASAITEAVIEEKLRPRGVAENTLTELHELFQTCNLARYAPVTSGQELAALVPRFESVLRELQNFKS